MTASAAGMTKGLSEADRALQLLQKIVEQNQQSLVKFGAEADKTAASLERIGDTSSFLATIEVGRVLVDIAQTVASAFTQVGATIGSIVAPVSAAIDATNDLAARTGINVEQLQKYGFAAKLAGVDTAAFGKAVQALTLNIGKANPGDELDKSLKRINLSVAELRSLAPEKQFSVIGEQISQLPTVADRAAASVAIFGKQGAALAPLFREGAASIEELQARAERLGIIISETQVNNVADMNDAFDTVRATIEGIIGQVLGNLAPAVTTVTEQFLKFVEEWSGSQGTGGTGIANAITDVLLRGAKFFADTFDTFMGQFEGITVTLADVGNVFEIGGKLLVTGMEGFRTVFNAIQIGIDALLIGFGRLLEGIGSWVSDDLEQFGAGLAAASEASAQKNIEEMEAAAKNAATAFSGIFVEVGDNAEQRGQGAAGRFVDGLQQGIEKARKPEVQLQTNLAKTQKDLDNFLSTATDGGSEFLQQSKATLEFFNKSAEAGNLSAAEIKIMAGFAAKVNEELDREKTKRQKIIDATNKQVEADTKRIDAILQANQAQTKIEADLSAVEREQARVQQELNAARDAGQSQQADQAAARLAQLDQLQASLQDQQQAFEQGFGDGFGKAFEATNKQVNDLINKAAEFGNAGAEAAQQFQQGVARVQQQARDGILNAEGYQQEIQRQRALFEQQLGVIKNEEQEKLAAAKRVDDFLRQGIDARRQAELDAAKQLEERKKQAALNVAAIQKRIEEEEKRNQEARDKGNMRDARDSTTRLRQLRALQREENAIAEGNGRRVSQTFARAASQQNNAFEQFASAATRQVQQFNNAVSESVYGVNAALEASAEGLSKIAREQRASLMLGPQQVAAADVRTAEGQQMVLDAAAQYQDPVLIQMRQQQKVLQQIAQGLTRNLNRIGVPAALV